MKLLLLVELFKWDSWLSKTVNLHCKGLTLATSVATVKQVFLGLGYLYICTYLFVERLEKYKEQDTLYKYLNLMASHRLWSL